MKGEKRVSEENKVEISEEQKAEFAELEDNTEEVNAEVLEDKEFEEIDELKTDAVIDELKSANIKLSEENKKLSNELEALKDRLLRTNAEYDNFRKRTAKEKEGIYTDACEDVLKNMFPVLDNLERAYAVNGNVEDIKKGIEMTIRQFKDSLEKLLVEEISSEGEFDPNFHNAVMHIEDETIEKNKIVEVFQKGYKKGDKVLRFSMVKVAN